MPARYNKPTDAPVADQRLPGAESDHRRALKGDEEARRDDPHGHGIAGTADREEPRGSPTSDRHKSETTTGRIKGDRAAKA
jgi:hypothetical protein